MNDKSENLEKKIKGQVLQEIDEQNEQIQHLKDNVDELCERLTDIMNISEEKAKKDPKETKQLVPIAEYIRVNSYCIKEINEKVKDMLDNIEL
jgi:uncharacterized protein YgfB (UPF0149 family)